MNFEKKLIIMSGANNAKGTVSLESNAYGTFVSVNVYNAPDLSSSEYALGIKNSGGIFTREMGSLGRIVSRFKVNDMPLCDTHCVLYDSSTYAAIMYGTNAREKLWEANLMDGIRREKVEKAKNYENISPKKAESALPVYSARQGIEDYFLDILPKEDKYYDNAIAEVNYYDGALGNVSLPLAPIDVSNIYSGEKVKKPPVENDIEAAATVNSHELPYIYEMRYLYRHRGGNIEVKSVSGTVSQSPQAVLASSQTAPKQANTEQSSPVDTRQPQVNMTSQPLASDTQQQRTSDTQYQASDTQQQRASETQQRVSDTQRYQMSDTQQYQASDTQQQRASDTQQRTSDTQQQRGSEKKTFAETGVVMGAEMPKSPPQLRENNAIPRASLYSVEDAVREKRSLVSFYEQVEKQIAALFAKGARYETLETIMPNTKWVKIMYDNHGKFYVVGLIGSKPDYICYGVPSKYSPEPPEELDGYCNWLPLDNNPTGDGFWLMYQDAATGESVLTPR